MLTARMSFESGEFPVPRVRRTGVPACTLAYSPRAPGMNPMFRDALFLARKDIRLLLRGGETILWTFVMPVVFFYFIGTITGKSGDFSTGAHNVCRALAGCEKHHKQQQQETNRARHHEPQFAWPPATQRMATRPTRAIPERARFRRTRLWPRIRAP